MPDRNATAAEWLLAEQLATAIRQRYRVFEPADITVAFLAGRLVDIADQEQDDDVPEREV